MVFKGGVGTYMAKETQLVQMSGYLFLLGVIVAIIAGLMPGVIPSVGLILLVLGTLIGLLAIVGWAKLTAGEENAFLLATVALIAAGASGSVLAGVPMIGAYLENIVKNIAALVAPAAVLIALLVAWRVGAGKVRLLK